MKIIGIIPARFASSRFPGKPLVEIQGKTMIQRVYEQVEKAELVNKTIIATDDERIFNHVKSFGGQVLMTHNKHQSGTERCAEIIEILKNKNEVFDIAINIQGDEPFIAPELISDLSKFLISNNHFQIATSAKKISNEETLFNNNVVKVVKSNQWKALYFSRQTIPFIRGEMQENWLSKHDFYKHIGIYAFRTATLLEIVKLPISTLEKLESLEQLRWLENDFPIGIMETELETIGIDTPEDLEKAIKYLSNKQN